MELMPIAVAAITGFKNPLSPIKGERISGTVCEVNKGYKMPAATGTSSMLYAKAQNRFCFMVLMQDLLNWIDLTIEDNRLPSIVIWADSIAMSVPLPIAIPKSA